VKEIQLTQGKVALVDDEDYDWLNQWKWFAHKEGNNWYVRRKYKGKMLRMHRVILGLTQENDIEVDHINRIGSDNRRDNLRICNHSQNMKNYSKKKETSSQYKGVTWVKNRKKWQVSIKANGKNIWLGYFLFEELAALAYDFAALKYHREFAHFNY